MLSHLRFHRRGQNSSPSSPGPDQQPATAFGTQQSPQTYDGYSPQETRPASSGSAALPHSLPPTLPPITRVTTDESDLRQSQPRRVETAAMTATLLDTRQDSRPLPMARSHHDNDSGFIGGLALHKYRQNMQVQAGNRQEKPDLGRVKSHEEYQQSRVPPSRPKPAAAYTDAPIRPPPQPLLYTKMATSFSTPTDLQVPGSAATGRRPAGASIAHEASALASAQASAEPQRTKKGLPFLKNPMSTLLLRRKNGQNVPELSPLRTEEPMVDPRIRGTRVHDFSAPRRSNIAVVTSNAQSRPAPPHGHPAAPTRKPLPRGSRELARVPSGADTLSTEGLSAAPSQSSQNSAVPQPPDRAAPPVPPKDGTSGSVYHASSQASRVSMRDTRSPPRTAQSSRVAHSRNISEISNKDAIPRHMKSTSSRFSFDMIGVAEQERIMEERHRQRASEKGMTGPDDPQYDEFDEDAFDYDAMMDDDGLEERIPGVNADYEEEEDFLVDDNYAEEDYADPDPDNDQEHFAGFAFQRSEPSSSQATPHAVADMQTARDFEGNPVLPEETTPGIPERHFETSPSGLHIQESSIPDDAEVVHEKMGDTLGFPLPPGSAQRSGSHDELYFDDGLTGFRNELADELDFQPEIGGEPFDESIFDVNDTDQYGRPIPGAFAKAQSSRRVASQAQSCKRASDMTSRFSAQSGTSRSTAHTSLSQDAGLSRPSVAESAHLAMAPEETVSPPSKLQGPQDSMAVYQAALAAAANEAAASGKFQRSPSPAVGDHSEDRRSIRSGFDDSADEREMLEDYEQEYEDLDGLDDDAIIAEANADALANDSDGWYGHEFGFYAAPNSNSNNANTSDSAPTPDYLYANGGFFGPKGADGLNRTKSGRMISQEPNLTPITERSEYSNRNSVMSMAYPPFSSATPIQSPGLAQLAMMADLGDDQMTLSALLKLRSKAWGGSQVSLVSSKDGSPRSERGDQPSSPWTQQFSNIPTAPSGHARKPSVMSTASRESDGGSGSGSPTMTAAGYAGLETHSSSMSSSHVGEDILRHRRASEAMPPPPRPMPQQPQTNAEPTAEPIGMPASATSRGSMDFTRAPESARTSLSASSRRPLPPGGKGHLHKSSADSISYTKEEEEGGETRWVIERRRTGETGRVEVLEREVVDGSRI